MKKKIMVAVCSLALLVAAGACKKKQEQPVPQTGMPGQQMPAGQPGQPGMQPGQNIVMPKGETKIVMPDAVKGQWKAVVLQVESKKTKKTAEIPAPLPLTRLLVSAPGAALRLQFEALQDAFKRSPGFLRITRNTLMHGIGIWLATPLYVVFFVRNLGASDAWLGLQGTTASLATIAGFAIWRWIMARWGEPATLKRTIVLLGFYPVLVGLLGNLNLILFAVALNGLITPGVSLSHFNSLLKVTPEEKRPEYTALYFTIVNVGIFICPMLGVAIANTFGLAPTLIACGLLSVLGSTSFWWWPVRKDEG